MCADTSGSSFSMQLDSSTLRVVKWRIEPGGHIPMHSHEHEYVVVPLTSGSMYAVSEGGEIFHAILEAGISYHRPSGATHRVENRDPNHVIEFVEIERLS